MEEKEVIGVLDGLLSKGVSESEIIEYKTNLFDKEMFGKYISALSNAAALYDEKWADIFWRTNQCPTSRFESGLV